MYRRSFLATCGTGLVAVAGCVTDDGGEPASSPTVSNPRDAFRAAVEQHTTHAVQEVALDGRRWTVSYPVETCCGDKFRAHQATIARNFSAVRPENVSLTVTSFHECLNIHWQIPSELARNHRTGDIATETYEARVYNTTTRESTC